MPHSEWSDNDPMSDTDFNFGKNVEDESAKVPDYFEGTGCMGSVRCTKCGKHHGYCIELEQEKKMLPRPGDDSTNVPSRKKQTGSGMVYLRNEDLSLTPQEAKILAVKYDGENKFGARVIMKLAFQGKIFFKGLNIKKDPNYQIAIDHLGQDENDWAGQKILLSLEKDDFSEGYYQRISFPEEKPRAGRK